MPPVDALIGLSWEARRIDGVAIADLIAHVIIPIGRDRQPLHSSDEVAIPCVAKNSSNLGPVLEEVLLKQWQNSASKCSLEVG